MYDANYLYEPRKTWWWVQGDTYKIAFGGLPGYQAIEEYDYRNWIPPTVRKMFVLKKTQ